MKRTDSFIDFKPLNPNTANIHIVNERTEDDDNQIGFHGTLREFTTTVGNPIPTICAAKLELIIDNAITLRDVENYAQQNLINQKKKITGGDEIATVQPGKRFIEASDGKEYTEKYNWSGLMERVGYVEKQIQQWSSIYNKLEGRMKRVELHQRGCQVDGRLLTFGQRHQNLVDCTECQCSSSGELHCGPIGCVPLNCTHPRYIDGKCCPECGNQCLYNGQYYENGESFWPKQCVRCFCNNGRMECQFLQTGQCPVLHCAEQEIPLNQCCPKCVNVDHCAAGNNPCHSSAHCESTQFSAKCTCKSGFFGNGTLCYDIDECQWDQSARNQLGGCQAGTICINLPGSFKCDCLPGFQKLDERNCLDVIRI